MRNLKKIFVAILTALCIVGLFSAAACKEKPTPPDPPQQHTCTQVCPECGKCTDLECTEEECKDKCGGHDDPTPPTPPDEHTCSKVCPECGGCLDAECEDEACKTKCGGDKTPYVFEAENAALGAGVLGSPRIENETLVGNMNENVGATITFMLKAEAATTASLVVSVCRRSVDTVFTDNIYVLVNDEQEIISPAVVPETGTGGDGWFNWAPVNLGCVKLQEGNNTISFMVMTKSPLGAYNFDKITLLSDAAVEETHICLHACEECGLCQNLLCFDEHCAKKCGCEHGGAGTVFSFLTGQASAYPLDNNKTAVYTGKGKTTDITVNFVATAAGKATLGVYISQETIEKVFTEFFDVTLNGKKLSLGGKIEAQAAQSWNVYHLVEVGEIDVKEGFNSINFKATPTEKNPNYNLKQMLLYSDNIEFSWAPHACSHVCETCRLCQDFTCLEDGCAGKCSCIGGAKGTVFSFITGQAEASPLDNNKTAVYTGRGRKTSVTVSFAASQAGTVKLGAYLSTDTKAVKFTDYFKTTVNEEVLSLDGEIPAGEVRDWNAYRVVPVGDIQVKEGVNVITFFAKPEEDVPCFNFKEMILFSDDISFTWAHKCTSACIICGKCTDMECTEELCADKCKENSVRYKAVNAKVEGISPNIIEDNVGMSYGAKITITFTVKVDKKDAYGIYLETSSNPAQKNFSDIFNLKINGEDKEVNAKLPVGAMWRDFTPSYLGEFELEEGDNAVVVYYTVVESNHENANDYLFTVRSLITTHVEHACEHVCSVCGGCLNSECQDSACATKCGCVSVTAKAVTAEVSGISPNTVEDNVGMSYGANITITWRVMADKAGKARLFLETSSNPSLKKFSEIFNLKLNGEDKQVNAILPNGSVWRDFTYTCLGDYNFVKGENVIVVYYTVVPNGTENINDYMYTVRSLKVESNIGIELAPEFKAVEANVDGIKPNTVEDNVSMSYGKTITIEWKLYVEKATTVKLYLKTSSNPVENDFSTIYNLKINGEDKQVTAKLPVGQRWGHFVGTYLGEYELKAGENSIVIYYTVVDGNTENVNDYMYSVRSIIVATTEKIDWAKEQENQ